VRHSAIEFAGTNAPPGIDERECWMPWPFYCPVCDQVLTCDEDYGSGSNHYWTLRCTVHGRYTASTYRHGGFDGGTPRAWPEANS
jgi:hypothetical protein